MVVVVVKMREYTDGRVRERVKSEKKKKKKRKQKKAVECLEN